MNHPDEEGAASEDLSHFGEMTPEELAMRKNMLLRARQFCRTGAEDKDLVVYYPASGVDKSVAEAFPESRGIYVDCQQYLAFLLHDQLTARYPSHRAEVLHNEADAVDPGPVDLVCLMGSKGIDVEKIAHHVKPGGCVILSSNDGAYFDMLHAHPDFRFVGVVAGLTTDQIAHTTDDVRAAIADVTGPVILSETSTAALEAFARPAVTDAELARSVPLYMANDEVEPGMTYEALWHADRRRYLAEARKHIPDLNPKAFQAGNNAFYVFQKQ